MVPTISGKAMEKNLRRSRITMTSVLGPNAAHMQRIPVQLHELYDTGKCAVSNRNGKLFYQPIGLKNGCVRNCRGSELRSATHLRCPTSRVTNATTPQRDCL